MDFTIPIGAFKLSLAIEKRNKIVITYLPDSDVLRVLKETDKGDFLASKEAKNRVREYQKSLKTNNFWKLDDGYDFIEKHLPKGKISLIDVGCHVGQLPFFLKQTGKWESINYTGTDVMKTFIDLAKKEHKGGVFFLSNIQEHITDQTFDVVFTKGTIISTFDPIKSAQNVLSIPSKKTFLLHTPIASNNIDEDYYNILVHNKEQVYTSSVLTLQGLQKVIDEKGFKIVENRKRPKLFKVLNKGGYHLHDFLLKKI